MNSSRGSDRWPRESDAPKIAAVVLAAGQSRRMGRAKLLLPLAGRPILARVIDSLRAGSELASILVVTGHGAQDIQAVIDDYSSETNRVSAIHNPGHAEGGMLSSVQAGARALPDGVDAFLLALGDQPMICPRTITDLVAAWHPETAPIVVPVSNGKRGHPVLIASGFTAEILALAETETLKTLMVRHAAIVKEVDVDDPATEHDIDTPEDYDAALRRWNSTAGPGES